MLTEADQKLLEVIAERHIVRKSELKMLSNNGSSFNVLLDNGLIKTVSPLGETVFVITQKGIRFLREDI